MTNSPRVVCQIWQDYKMARQEAKLGQIRAQSDKWWPLNHQRTRLCFTWWRKSGRNSFTANGNLTTLCILTKPHSSYLVHEPNQVTQCKMLSKSTFKKIPTGTYPSIQLDRRTMWNTPRVREASWLLRDLQLWASEEDYNPFPGRILLRTRPTLCAYEIFHHITTYSILRIMIFVPGTICVGVHFL